MLRLLLIGLSLASGLFFAGCANQFKAEDDCVSKKALYKAADKRQIDKELFGHALACKNTKRVEQALISLGRIGGKDASTLIKPLLNAENSKVRATAAFSLGISGQKEYVVSLYQALKKEQSPQVQREIGLAIGILASDDSWNILTEVIKTSTNTEAVRGALQGLGILSIFNPSQIKDKALLQADIVIKYLKNPNTALEASFLLARTSLIKQENAQDILQIYPELNDSSKAFVLRAMAKVSLKSFSDLYVQESQSQHIGIRLNSLTGLGKHLNQHPAGFEVLQKQSYAEDIPSQVTSISQLQPFMHILRLKSHLLSDSSWVKSEALINYINSGEELSDVQEIATNWLESQEPNLERAAIAYFAKQNDKATLESLSNHSSKIIANGAKQALEIEENSPSQPLATPKHLENLPKSLALNTTKGEIVIKLFADTPYTSSNFVRLAKEGFYDNSYFHRVIPNFVAQGGSSNGDGSGTVDYMIREELSMRSHLTGTIGMATAGKDTGGAQFFINLAPNLHLDSNYTIFGEVLSGMEVAQQLEQNDQILSVEFNNK